MRQILTERIFESSLDCMHKCRLLLGGKRGNKTEYEDHMDRFATMYQRAAIARIQEMNPQTTTVHIGRITPSTLHAGAAQLLIIRRVEVNGLRSDSVVLARTEDGCASYQPVLFYRYEEITIRAKLLLAFRAALIEKATGVALRHGRIIYGPDFSHVQVPLSAFVAKTENIISRINEMAVGQEPALFLCSHCQICEFEARCHSRAVAEDNLSLIQGIGPQHIEDQARKGIFTLNQYSHTFRSRRLPKRVKNPSKPRYFALQARALRDNKIYIHGHPTLPGDDTSIYFDIEGIPSRRSYYLIGMLVVTGSGELYKYFWANDKPDQPGMFARFCDAVAAYPNASLFHFGAYEARALKEMREYVGDQYRLLVDRILGSCHNVLPVLHHHCYLPTYSNRLKDVAGFLGYQFDNQVRSGIGSIVYRERWEETSELALKTALITYNRQDCEALKTVCEFVRKSDASAAARERAPGREVEVVSAESLRKVGEGIRPVFRKPEFIYPEFELANKCAYFDYQRDHVFARTHRLPPRSRSKPVKYTKRRLSLATNVWEIPSACPACGSKKLRREKQLVRWQIDLKFYKTQIGVKKWQPRYLVSDYRCPKCGVKVTLPTTPFVAGSRVLYGHGLMCWCVYQSILGKQSMLSVHRGLKDIFNLNIPHGKLYVFKGILASYYTDLSKEILGDILNADVIYIDETSVKLRRTMGYVWVISSANNVYYLFRESREGDFLKELLGTYHGILVSDFFTAYDSLKCRQQKCLVHLMRDMNDDLRRNPYDQELRSITEPFAKLLKDIILTIDRYGLRRRHLHKYAKAAEKMCTAMAGRHFTSVCATKFQSRFEKYGDRLFTFLNYDGVPWNNNNAEHAVHRFARLRQIADGTFTHSSVAELLVLLSVLETCEYRTLNPLKFLLSGKRELRELEGSQLEQGESDFHTRHYRQLGQTSIKERRRVSPTKGHR